MLGAGARGDLEDRFGRMKGARDCIGGWSGQRSR